MVVIAEYNRIKENLIQICKDGTDYEVWLNGMVIFTTGAQEEAELIAEVVDVGLNILQMQERLK